MNFKKNDDLMIVIKKMYYLIDAKNRDQYRFNLVTIMTLIV